MNGHQTRLEELTTRLKQGGHRLTPQRMAVLRILANSEEHPSVEQIYERVKANFPMTSLATIYKTVTTLKDMGEVLVLGFSDSSNRYDGRDPHPHPHLICVECRGIVDIDVAALRKLPQEVAQSTDFRIMNHRFDFFGVCPQCQKRE